MPKICFSPFLYEYIYTLNRTSPLSAVRSLCPIALYDVRMIGRLFGRSFVAFSKGDKYTYQVETRRKDVMGLPYLRFTGFSSERLQALAPVVIDVFSEIVHISKEKVKIERSTLEPILNVPLTIEIRMFSRAQSVHDQIASNLAALLREEGFETVHIYFLILSPELYYKDGVPIKPITES
ncbi:hypothetical protein BleG1_3407 [Shouchella lehensis G1]|uniref:DUF1904 family protein n=2 Tax=Bacillaceae TaxID=186817 RepID=A0A060M7A0_9BACI|nr:hypothetical protein BleG1_3407 [Shouchella lehensis G1]